MNLIIDIGNSRTKIAVVDNGQVVDNYVLEDVVELENHQVFGLYPTISKAIVASTAQSTDRIAEWLRKRGLYVVEMSSSTPVPLRNGYLTPETLGVDRLAAAVGASQMVEGDCLVVDFGTAITIDLVIDGEFRGGNISPGMRTRFRALHDYTLRLPECDATDEILPIGKTTSQAIEQGVMQGITYEIEGYIRAFLADNVKLSIIFTGGDAKFFDKRIKNAIFAKCDLVVCGLNTILDYNARFNEQNI